MTARGKEGRLRFLFRSYLFVLIQKHVVLAWSPEACSSFEYIMSHRQWVISYDSEQSQTLWMESNQFKLKWLEKNPPYQFLNYPSSRFQFHQSLLLLLYVMWFHEISWSVDSLGTNHNIRDHRIIGYNEVTVRRDIISDVSSF